MKIPLGLWEGSTENATLVSMLLADLVDRGLDPEQAILFVIDGGKAIRKAIKDVFGEHALVHRCHRHKERNCRTYCPSATAHRSWSGSEARGGRRYQLAEQRLEPLASELDRTWPAPPLAARGDAETLT